ncbi:DUF4145 domain-containing protein [Nonomuraea sp. SYSU D8015]|uniref:DUF4145 domain-containing protein n=1 Tax=Nonomuraea sp. SYSU D8015 TaxID=2593644 RepID=UPI0016603DC2|nr:DUF4145 domain-containing protein [Nonomuraea sp. SYSU D8015]
MDLQQELDTLACPSCGDQQLILDARSEGYALARCNAPAEYGSCGQVVLYVRLLSGLRQMWPPARPAFEPSIPTALADSLAEAQVCHDSGAHTAATIMVRRLLEALCADHGVSPTTARGGFKSLNTKLQELHTSGVITGQLYDWAIHLKDVGNDSAHDTDSRASFDDAADAIALAQHMLGHLYVTPARYAQAKARRDREQAIKRLPITDVAYVVDLQEDGALQLVSLCPEAVSQGAQGPLAEVWGTDHGDPAEFHGLLEELHRKTASALTARSWRLGQLVPRSGSSTQ